jgi:hypothetical protein
MLRILEAFGGWGEVFCCIERALCYNKYVLWRRVKTSRSKTATNRPGWLDTRPGHFFFYSRVIDRSRKISSKEDNACLCPLLRISWDIEKEEEKMSNALDEYQYARKFILSHIRQVRMMVRDGRYVTEGRGLIKKAQADAAARRFRAYAA